MNERINYKAVYRAAPATPGLLIKEKKLSNCIELFLIKHYTKQRRQMRLISLLCCTAVNMETIMIKIWFYCSASQSF